MNKVNIKYDIRNITVVATVNLFNVHYKGLNNQGPYHVGTVRGKHIIAMKVQLS